MEKEYPELEGTLNLCNDIINKPTMSKEIKYDGKIPCRLDHNGECLICDCWLADCGYDRYLRKDYKWETKEELEKMFKDFNNKTNKQ